MKPKLPVYLVFVWLNCAAFAALEERIDASLAAEINSIQVIDNHAHDEPADVKRGETWNPKTPLGKPRYPDVVALRRDNPEWIAAWKALYNYPHADASPGHLSELLERKLHLMREQGENWPVKVLDAAKVDIVLVNATSLGAGQLGPRFRWVPYADPMMILSTRDKALFQYTGAPVTLSQLLADAKLTALPETLALYETGVIEVTLARWAANRAVAIKFLEPYRRALDFAAVTNERAAAIYLKTLRNEEVSTAEQKALEDYLFAEICRRAGTLGLVVHIHTGNGDGPYFDNSRANPSLLESALNSRPLRATKFVLLHGGWPYTAQAQAMLDKPNTYTDFSAQTFYLTTYQLAQNLRALLSWQPEKVLFGSDAYSDSDSPLTDYEEKQWLTTDKARRALGLALTAMIADGEITRERAIEIARMVLRENAAGLYHLK